MPRIGLGLRVAAWSITIEAILRLKILDFMSPGKYICTVTKGGWMIAIIQLETPGPSKMGLFSVLLTTLGSLKRVPPHTYFFRKIFATLHSY